MLWWGMDETLAELFACHLSCCHFEGNPLISCGAFIAGEEYDEECDAEQTPDLLGLYGGRYTIVFHPGESWQAVCAGKVKANPCMCSYPGIDYVSREIDNDMLVVEHHSGESKMSNEEFDRGLWREDQLRPATGGRVFEARMVGTGYMHQFVE